jgi:pyruvate-formate lyase-activating enzyme
MNIRCAFCQNPYTLSRNEILFALQKIDSEKLNHYDAHCPRCRRATQLPTQRLEMAFPNWRQAVQEQAAMPPAPILEPKTAPALVVAQSTPEPVKVEPATKAAPQIATPVAKKIEAKKTAPTKTEPAVLKKTAAKKTAAKAKPVAKKPAKSRRK